MHNSSWSKIRKILEEDRLCPALRDRVQYFMTRYHDAHDDYGRFCVRVDGKEYVCGSVYQVRFKLPPVPWTELRAKSDAAGIYHVWEFGDAINAYLDDLSIEDALTSDDLLVRMLAVLDRRVGKRRLPTIAAAMKNEPEWLQFFYRLRLEAEGYDVKEESTHA